MEEILGQFSAIPNLNIALSLLFSFLSYLVLTVYDGLGVRYIGEDLSAGRIVRAGYVGYAFSHNIGMALITGGSIRYRIYSVWGLSGIQVTQIVAFSALTLWIGFCSVAGLSLIFATPHLPDNVSIPFDSLQIVGAALFSMVIGYLFASVTVDKEISFRGWTFSFPDITMALKQVVIASIDWVMAGLVLYVLLPEVGISFFSFIGVFLLAQIIGLFSQVPGGLGVFESVMLLYLSNFMKGSEILGILLVYRLIYYILPLLGAVVVLAYQEYQVNRMKVKSLGQKAADWIPRVVPEVLSVSVFIGGAILLFSGSMPSEIPRMEWLQVFLPLPVIEMSHFLASLVGVGMMVLARNLKRRVHAAYQITIGLLVFGIFFTLMRGADYEEASFLLVMLGTLIPCRKEFHRKTSLINKEFSAGWLTMIGLVIVSALWLGVFSYRNVAYSEELWWHFTLLGDAPRYLRAMVGVLAFTFIIALIKVLKPREKKAREAEEEEIGRVREILKNTPQTKPNVALLRNKQLIFSENKNAFIMYMASGNSYVAMGDPIGPEEEIENLLWDFNDFCEAENKWPIFYQVGEKYLDFYLDLGLTFLKIGEEARVELQDFTLSNIKQSELVDRYSSLGSEGYTFEVIPRAEVSQHLSDLEKLSRQWNERNETEKDGFSHGIFDAEYLKEFNLALVRKRGQPVAYSNIWVGADQYEVSFDVLRSSDRHSEDSILFLLLELMLWGKRQQYQWFSLGMAPLSGLEDHQHTARWNKVANWVYTYGDNLYSFSQVRAFREQFDPVWEPRFMAIPGGWALPGAVSNVGSLVIGGFRGLLKE